jgi:hypothetical protein
MKINYRYTGCLQKRRRVHNSVIYRKILIICTPNKMVVNRLQNGLIDLSIAPWASRVNCQNIFFQMGLHIFFSNSDRDFNPPINKAAMDSSFFWGTPA